MSKTTARRLTEEDQIPLAFGDPEPEQPRPVHALSKIVSKRECAAFFDVSTTAIDRWLDAGAPVATRGPGGAVTGLELASIARWRIDRTSDAGGDLERERTRLVAAQADRAQMEAAELRGELVRAPVIGLHWQAMVAAMRAELLSVPSRLAPHLLHQNNLAAVTEKVRDQIYSALEHIAGDGFADEVRKKLAELRKENP